MLLSKNASQERMWINITFFGTLHIEYIPGNRKGLSFMEQPDETIPCRCLLTAFLNSNTPDFRSRVKKLSIPVN